MGLHSEWTADQRALATPGCTIEVELGEGDDQGMATGEIVSADVDDDGLWLNVRITHDDGAQEVVALDERDADPDTVKPPTMATLNRLAVESFGEGASVEYVGSVGCLRVRLPDGGRVKFDLSTDDEDARECARWLAARGR